MKLIRLLEQALSSFLLIGREALAISSWPAQKRRNPSLVPVWLRSILELLPAARKLLIASFMIGNTVLEPPIRMEDGWLPLPWAWATECPKTEAVKTEVETTATPNQINGNRGRPGRDMETGTKAGVVPVKRSMVIATLRSEIQQPSACCLSF